MSDPDADAGWTEIDTGTITIGDGAPETVAISRWHWRMLRHLAVDRAHDVPSALAELRFLAPNESAGQLVTWYVEAAYAALDGLEADGEEENSGA